MDRRKKRQIVVFGSFVADLTSRQNGMPRPGETLLGNSFQIGPGGKGSNQAVAAHRAGAEVTLITKLGRDLFADLAMDFYTNEGMDTSCVLVDETKKTGAALIMVDEKTSQNQIVVIPGACMHFSEKDVERYKNVIASAKVVLLQLETNLDAVETVIRTAHAAGSRVILNPAPANAIPDELYPMIDVITPNETEAAQLTGVEVTDLESARASAKVFLERGVKNVVITLGEKGVYANDGKRDELLGRVDVDAVDSTGAGDAFSGCLATALSEDLSLFRAIRFANAGAALSVTKHGTAPAMAKRAEIDFMMRVCGYDYVTRQYVEMKEYN